VRLAVEDANTWVGAQYLFQVAVYELAEAAERHGDGLARYVITAECSPVSTTSTGRLKPRGLSESRLMRPSVLPRG
jgi:hypothetical protein